MPLLWSAFRSATRFLTFLWVFPLTRVILWQGSLFHSIGASEPWQMTIQAIGSNNWFDWPNYCPVIKTGSCPTFKCLEIRKTTAYTLINTKYQLKTWMYEYPQSHACCRNLLFNHLGRCSSSLWQVWKDFLIQTNLHGNQLAEMKKVSGIQWLHVLMTGNNHWQQEVHNYQVKLLSRCYNWTTVPTKEAVVTSTYLRLCFL